MDVSLDQVASLPVVFALCAASGILLPFPEDVPVLVAGIAASAGEVAIAPAISGALAGVLVRDLVLFGAGRIFGEALFRVPLLVRVVGPTRIEAARVRLMHRGPRAVFAGRFLVGVRAPVFLTAGVLGMPLRDFVLWDALGLVIMVPGMFSLGYLFGAPALGVLEGVVAHAGWVAAALCAVVVAVAAAAAWRARA